MYTQDELSGLNRKELQKLCKQHQIKANKKNCELVEDLFKFFSQLKAEEQNLEEDLRQDVEISEETNSENADGTYLVENEEQSDDISPNSKTNLKSTMLREIERRAAEKVTKIPRYKVAMEEENFLSPTAKKINAEHQKNFKKMVSVDEYLERKRKRAETNLSYNKRLKLQSEKTLQRMKMSHNTPKANIQKGRKSVRISKSNATPDFSKANLKVDKEVSFKFTTASIPKASVLKENNSKINSSSCLSGNEKRKSVSFRKATSVVKPNFNLTVGHIRSPAPAPSFFSPNKSMTSKTPVKFDLQASLKKPLQYKPHTGKIKEVYYADRKSMEKCNMRGVDRKCKVSVKERTKPTTTRESRRLAAASKAKSKRGSTVAKQRGIVC